MHVVNQISLPRATLALLFVAVMLGGALLGGMVTTVGTASPTPTPGMTAAAAVSPSAAPMPPADVDGDDLARLPRYPASVRTEFQVSVDEQFRLTVTEYLAAAELDDVRTFYQNVIADHGWQRADIAFSGGEWTYVLVDGASEALVEIEETGGLIEIDLQLSEPSAPAPTADPAPPTQQPAAPPPPGEDDDGDDGDDDDGDDGGSDDGDD